MNADITQDFYRSIQIAADFFNKRLFDGTLPPVLITLNRRQKCYGYFWQEKFSERSDSKQPAKVSEIALNPDGFVGRTDKDILSTLVHELVHLEVFALGKAPKKVYHCKFWGTRMKKVGLYPSTTGVKGGKETGRNCSHYILPGEAYDKAYGELATTGFKLNWESIQQVEDKKPVKSKVKFECECGARVWGKPGSKVICGECFGGGELMKSEDGEDD